MRLLRDTSCFIIGRKPHKAGTVPWHENRGTNVSFVHLDTYKILQKEMQDIKHVSILSLKRFFSLRQTLTLILLTWRIWWASKNASRWHMGFNTAFKGLYGFSISNFRRVPTRPNPVTLLNTGSGYFRAQYFEARQGHSRIYVNQKRSHCVN